MALTSERKAEMDKLLGKTSGVSSTSILSLERKAQMDAALGKTTTSQPRIQPKKENLFVRATKAVIDPLANAGEGAGLSVGNLGTGVLGGALKLVGADKAAQGVENFRQKAFVQPTLESQKTFSGQAGKVATDVLSYMTPGGIPAQIGKDALIGFGQSNGDVAAGVVSGVTSGVVSGVTSGITGGLGKIPVVKNTVGNMLKTLAPGYTSDVVQGVAGQRGEDRTGTNAFFPGAGTVFSGVLGAGVKGTKAVQKAVQKARNQQTYLDATAKSWDVPENAKNAKFDKAKVVEKQAKIKGFDVKRELAEDGVFLNKNVTDGKYDVKDVVNNYRQKGGNSSEYLSEAIKLRTPSVLREKSGDIYEQAIRNIDPTNTEGNAIIKYLRKEAKLQKPEFGFDDIYNKKKYYGSKANWKIGMPGDGIAEKGNAALNKVFKDMLIQKGKEAGIPVDRFLNMQEQNYKVADYLEALDGARVPTTTIQKIRGGVLRTAGALVGAKGGPYGAVAGYHGAGVLDSVLGDLPKPLRDAVMKDYQKATPQVQKEMIEIIQETIAEQKSIKALSGKNTIFPTRDASGIDTQGMNDMSKYYEDIRQQNTLRLPESTSNFQGIPIPLPRETVSTVQGRESSLYKNYPKVKLLELPAPRTVIPLNPNQTYTGNYSSQDLNKIKQDTGDYRRLNQSSVAMPTIIPNKAVSKKATIKVKLPRKSK